ncbi:MAG: HupE/UreJ family protein [Planctomycetota bacterium]|nr:HupE/UreJ family protein [Planctomycetota bacterium]
MTIRKHFALFAALALVGSRAWAHPGHAESGLAHGLAHPFSGLDHILAMVAVGLWAAQLGGRAVWAVPAAFVGMMVTGGALGMAGVPLPLVEAGILASVLVLGLLVAGAAKLPLYASLPLVAFFALFHGHAHGAELAAGASGWSYALGFVAATAALHAVGLGLGWALKRASAEGVVRVAGGLVSAAAVALWLNLL